MKSSSVVLGVAKGKVSRACVGALLVGLAAVVAGCATNTEEAASSEAAFSEGQLLLLRGYQPGGGHWASTGSLPYGFNEEARFVIQRQGARGIFACRVSRHNIVTSDPYCEGQPMIGFLGYLDGAPSPGKVAIYRCRVGSGNDHFISVDPGCEGQITEAELGWAEQVASPPPPPPLKPGECHYSYQCQGSESCVGGWPGVGHCEGA